MQQYYATNKILPDKIPNAQLLSEWFQKVIDEFGYFRLRLDYIRLHPATFWTLMRTDDFLLNYAERRLDDKDRMTTYLFHRYALLIDGNQEEDHLRFVSEGRDL